jgi:hypothetical protein
MLCSSLLGMPYIPHFNIELFKFLFNCNKTFKNNHILSSPSSKPSSNYGYLFKYSSPRYISSKTAIITFKLSNWKNYFLYKFDPTKKVPNLNWTCSELRCCHQIYIYFSVHLTIITFCVTVILPIFNTFWKFNNFHLCLTNHIITTSLYIFPFMIEYFIYRYHSSCFYPLNFYYSLQMMLLLFLLLFFFVMVFITFKYSPNQRDWLLTISFRVHIHNILPLFGNPTTLWWFSIILLVLLWRTKFVQNIWQKMRFYFFFFRFSQNCLTFRKFEFLFTSAKSNIICFKYVIYFKIISLPPVISPNTIIKPQFWIQI